NADLRFVNNTGATVYFETSFQNHRLTVTIYGRDKGPKITYRLDTDIVKTLTPKDQYEKSLPQSTIQDYNQHPTAYDRVLTKSGQAGHVVNTYLETYQGNRRLSRKLLRRNTYQATPNIYTLQKHVAPVLTEPTPTTPTPDTTQS
ncbi:MAG: hypothetical protein J6B20_00600, partial [Clostridia bacterium]|nr:hypothetical protein [Clostridia bacterium]